MVGFNIIYRVIKKYTFKQAYIKAYKGSLVPIPSHSTTVITESQTHFMYDQIF
jgi:hypothetical protein